MIYKIRLDNLLHLIKKEGSQRAFAEKVGRSEGQISQYVTGHKHLGDNFCRDVEKILNLPVHTLDRPKGTDQQPILDENALCEVIEAVDIVLENDRIRVSAARKTDLIMALYTLVIGGTELNPDLVKRMLRLMEVR